MPLPILQLFLISCSLLKWDEFYPFIIGWWRIGVLGDAHLHVYNENIQICTLSLLILPLSHSYCFWCGGEFSYTNISFMYHFTISIYMQHSTLCLHKCELLAQSYSLICTSLCVHGTHCCTVKRKERERER